MAVTVGSAIKRLYSQQVAVGNKAKNSDFYLEIAGFEGLGILFKQFPWPILSSGDAIETFLPLGVKAYETSQVQIAFQGPFTATETVDGKVQQFFESLIAVGGKVNAKLYEGVPTDYVRVLRIYDLMLKVDSAIDRSWENNMQVMDVTGTASFHFFGVEA